VIVIRNRSISFLANTAALPLIALTAAACSSGGDASHNQMPDRSGSRQALFS
jgi:hypothetical protein